MNTRIVAAIAICATVALLSRCSSWRSSYWARVVVWNNVGIGDHKIFPKRMFATRAPATRLARGGAALDGSSRPAALTGYLERVGASSLDDFLEKTDSTAFLVVHNGQLVYESYFNGYERDSINTSFSVAKSFASALIGFAIDDGLINDVSDPITKYIPELEGADYDAITIRHLLTMTSGIRYSGSHQPWTDAARAYYEPDLREFALTIVAEESPGKSWEYNNYHPILIGMIVERVTGERVSEYLERKIWKPLGMEFAGSWSLDNTGFEKMESGINARSIDFAKFGLLFLNDGSWNGERILSQSWVHESTRLNEQDSSILRGVRPGHEMSKEASAYKYFWWINPRPDVEDDFFAAGNLGQYIYASPNKGTVIVRNGRSWGGFERWVDFMHDLSDTVADSID